MLYISKNNITPEKYKTSNYILISIVIKSMTRKSRFETTFIKYWSAGNFPMAKEENVQIENISDFNQKTSSILDFPGLKLKSYKENISNSIDNLAKKFSRR